MSAPAPPEQVEQVADPRRWLSTRALLITIGVLVVIFATALVVTLVLLHQPDLPAVPIPSVPSA